MLEDVVGLLEDGKWHNFLEIKNRLSLPEDQFKEIFQFLKDFDLADIDEERGRVRISQSFLELQT